MDLPTASGPISLTPVGRSAALSIGSIGGEGAMRLTVTASTVRPVQLRLEIPGAGELREGLRSRVAEDLHHDDVHGRPA